MIYRYDQYKRYAFRGAKLEEATMNDCFAVVVGFGFRVSGFGFRGGMPASTESVSVMSCVYKVNDRISIATVDRLLCTF
jgi:hypothetical protein